MQTAALSRPLVALGFALAACVGPASAGDGPALRDAGCSNADLRGAYGFTARGSTLPGLPLPAPLLGSFASTGIAIYDGNGHVTLDAIASFNGVVQPAVTTGSYQVEPDCLFTSSLDNGTTFRGVIANNRQELLVLQTTPATAIAGTARKVASGPSRSAERDAAPAARCSVKTVRGTHAFLAEGFAGPPTLPLPAAGPLAGVGTVTYASDGRFVLVAQRSVNGALDPGLLQLNGSFAVDAACGITMAFDVGFHFDGTIADGGSEIRFVETDPGTTLLVTTKRM